MKLGKINTRKKTKKTKKTKLDENLIKKKVNSVTIFKNITQKKNLKT
jgi:hypothetical protein